MPPASRDRRDRSSGATGLDETDLRIIAALQADGRLPFAELAAKVSVSESSARRRYKRLVDSGLLRIVGVADVVALGLVRADVHVRVKGVSVDDVATALAALAEVDWVATCVGGADIVVNVICSDHRRLAELIDRGVRGIPGVDGVQTTLVASVVKDDYRLIDIARRALDQ